MKLSFFMMYVWFLLLPFSIFSASHEGRVRDVSEAREELSMKTKEVSAKQEEIIRKEQEIEQKRKSGDEASEKIAQEDLIKLNEELQTSLEAKIKAVAEVLNFKPKDSVTLKVEKELAAKEKVNIEIQIKKLQSTLASEGTSTTTEPSKISEAELTLGQRIGKNFEIWVTSKLTKVFEAFGDYNGAMNGYKELADLYGELNKPLQQTENLLAADRLRYKMHGVTLAIQDSMYALEGYIAKLDAINRIETEKLKKSTSKADTEKIKRDAQVAREKAFSKNAIKDIALNVLELRNEIARINTAEFAKSVGISEEALKKELAILSSDVESLIKQMDLQSVGPGPVKSELEQLAEATQKRANSLLSKNNLENLTAFLDRNMTGYGKNEKDFSSMMFYLDDLAKVKYSLLSDPRTGEKITNVLMQSYQKIQDTYGNFIRSDAFKKLPKDKQQVIQKRFNYFGSQAKRFEIEHANIMKDIELRNKFNSQEVKTYEALIAKNKNATIINPQRLEKIETALGNDKIVIQDALKTLAPENDAKIDALLKNFDANIKKIYEEISKADPSQRELESLQRILNALSDLMGEVNGSMLKGDLTSEVARVLAKAYLRMNIRFDQLASEASRVQGALTAVIGNNVVTLPQVIRSNVKEIQKIPTTGSLPNKSTIELAKNIWDAGANVSQKNIDEQNVLIDQIDKYLLQKLVHLSLKVQN